jgi:hypothetical protein
MKLQNTKLNLIGFQIIVVLFILVFCINVQANVTHIFFTSKLPDLSKNDLKKLDFVVENYAENKDIIAGDDVDLDEVKSYDIIFLAIPVDGIIDILKNLTDISEDTTIIDLGSTKEMITYNCLVVNNKTGKISNDNGSNTYEIINGKLKTIWTDKEEIDISYETLKSQTSTQWTILEENDSDRDENIDDIETTIWYIDKPANYPVAL